MNNLKEFPEEQKVNINKISEKMGKVVIKNKIQMIMLKIMLRLLIQIYIMLLV